MVAWQGIRLVLIGVGLGAMAATGLARTIDSLLYETSAADPLTYIVVSAAVIFVGSLACVAPAVRAVRLDAMAVLRQ
jgi:ABC-type antimicrobial peptide transport system permease subunit